MNHTHATALLDRYFAGTTTPAEEHDLKTYFRTADVPAELAPYASLFAYWEQQGAITAPPRKLTARPGLRRTLLAIAAALLLLLAVRGTYRWQQPGLTTFPVAERQAVDWSQHEITDEKEALRFLKTVLTTTSDKLNEGPGITVRELREVRDILD
ncbi:hypothetical protein LEM8419_00101 [Neolewinella maritima]|uniref:DUF4880 domain-containing protein n=1 Tax=Neolewinella maritima TaxID=1383882 RepID=A0ABN8EYE9_9BACT|nr:hypothetical protein [Neolewinella maritima]CAH0998753.1 hypothetical protein LEM8419_00101 [Neolewinella maritima]